MKKTKKSHGVEIEKYRKDLNEKLAENAKMKETITLQVIKRRKR